MVYKKRPGSRGVSEIIPDEEDMMNGTQDFAYQGGEVKKGGKAVKVIIAILIIAIVLVGGWYALGKYTNLNLPGLKKGGEAEVKVEGWHAVFLSNGQVYFGQIEKTTERDLILTDIYYLQVVNKPLQQSQAGAAQTPAATTDPAQQELTLAKLGNEIHGPVDKMVINRDHILLTEALKSDSKVVTAIADYLKKQAAQPAEQPQPPQQPLNTAQ